VFRPRFPGLLLAALLLAAVPAHAQDTAQPPEPSAAQPPDPGAPDTAPPAAEDEWDFEDEDDGWNFDDEGEAAVPTWGEIIEPQVLDLGLFTAFVVLAMVSFFRKSERLKIVVFILAIAYLGFGRGQLISVVNLFALASWNLPIFRYSLFWYLFAGFTIVSTVVWGRLYCGRICAYGALTQLLDKVVPRQWRYVVPAKIEAKANWIKYGLLVAVMVYYLVTRDNFVYRYVEPFWMFSMTGNAVMWSMLAVLLVATVFVRNLYCRFLCPVGAFLGVIAQGTTLFRIKRWKECNTCKICEKACEWGAIDGPKINRAECVRCDDCERIYDDKDTCVHWIVIRKKSDVLARQAAAGVVPTS